MNVATNRTSGPRPAVLPSAWFIQELVARGSGLHIPPGIDGRVVHSNFVVYVRPSGSAADACITNHFAALDACPGNRRERRKMSVPRCNSKTMIDNHQPAIARMVFCNADDPIHRRVNRSTIVRRHVYAGMKRAFTAERVQALAEAVGNVSHHRP